MSSSSTHPSKLVYSSKQESDCTRSLRECTTRRFTRLYSGESEKIPTLSSHVQWSTGRPQPETPIIDVLEDDVEEMDVASVDSPILSDTDELLHSDDDHPMHEKEIKQPVFPGNRDIMDRTDSNSSLSPSPLTQRSLELATPSPVSESAKGWAPPYHVEKPSTGLDLNLFPHKGSEVDDKYDHIRSWQVSSVDERDQRRPYYKPYEKHGSFADSPSASTSSTPPSPRKTLPPIQYLSSANNKQDDGAWYYRDTRPSSGLRRPYSAAMTTSQYYDDSRASSSSPQVLPPLLPHILGEQSYMHVGKPPATTYSATPGAPRNKNAWKEHAKLVKLPDGQTEWQCVWRVGNTGEFTDFCGYTAKRHLVKRHIETRHLQFKDHVCSHCGKAFPQRVSLMIHVNRHTGAKPHQCRYPDCEKTFSDPARRHKHMVEAHGYNPQGPRKRHRTTDSYHANNSHFETMTPWPTKPAAPPPSSGAS